MVYSLKKIVFEVLGFRVEGLRGKFMVQSLGFRVIM